MENNPVIALLTDFGVHDGYVASMKGVIHSLCKKVTVVDITHEISPQGIDEAAFVLWSAYTYFPKGTIFVIVVDPDVGTNRPIICVRSKMYTFLAPDNGVLKYIIGSERTKKTVSVINKKLFLPNISSTFNGRDIFAPVAASLRKGVRLSALGQEITPLTKPETFIPFQTDGSRMITGKIIHIDRFGNIITNILMKDQSLLTRIKSIRIGRNNIDVIHNTYSEEKKDRPFGLIGSTDLLEICMDRKNAAKAMNIKMGSAVKVELK
jgi:S-adenosyl-L-methionine hydrolase (adenosine-forming)